MNPIKSSFLVYCVLLLVGFLCSLDVQANEGQSSLPWEIGDSLDSGWSISQIDSQPEFVHLHLSRGKEQTSVEITYRRGDNGQWLSRYYQIQPLPGETPPTSILQFIQQQLTRLETQTGYQPFVKKASKKDNAISLELFQHHNSLNAAPIAGTGSFLLHYWFFGIVILVILWQVASKSGVFGTDRPAGKALTPISKLLRMCGKRTTSFALWIIGAEENNRKGRKLVRQDVYLALLWGAFISLLLAVLSKGVPLLDDSTEYLVWARDCLTGINCHFEGPPAIGNLKMGGLPVHVFVLFQWLGISVRTIHYLVIFMLGIQAAAAYLFAIWIAGRRYAVPVALFSIYLLLKWSLYPNLLNDSLTPLCVLAFTSAVISYIRNQSRIGYWGALLALFLAGEGHLINYLLLAPLLTIIGAYSRRPLLETIQAVFVLAIFMLVSSYEAYLGNLRLLIGSGVILSMIEALLLFSLLGFWLRPRLYEKRSRKDIRIGLALFGLIGYIFLQIVVPNISDSEFLYPTNDTTPLKLLQQVTFYCSAHYYQLVFPFCMLIFPVLAVRLLSWIASLTRLRAANRLATSLTVLMLIALMSYHLYYIDDSRVVHHQRSLSKWTYSDVNIIADELTEMGYSYSKIRQCVQLPGNVYFYQALPLYLPLDKLDLASNKAEHSEQACENTLRIVKVKEHSLPENLEKRYRIKALDGTTVAIFRAFHSWQDSSTVQLAYKMENGMANWEAFQRVTNPYLKAKPEETLFPSFYLYEKTDNLVETHNDPFPRWYSVSILATEEENSKRSFVVLGGEQGYDWKAFAIQGFRTNKDLPARIFELEGTKGAQGVLGCHLFGNIANNQYLYPVILELLPNEQWLQTSLTEMYGELEP